MKALKYFVSFILVFLIILGHSWFILRPITRRHAYREAVEKQYFEYENKMYKVELYDELEKPEIDKEKL